MSANPLHDAQHLYLNGSEVTDLVIPNDVDTIRSYAFNHGIYFTSITIPESVKFLGSYAFYYCSGLTSVTIPNSIDSIHEQTFALCKGLVSLTLPGNLAYIDQFAFGTCTNLAKIYNYRPTPADAHNRAFSNVNKSTCALHVLSNSVNLYKEAPVWSDFVNIYAIDGSTDLKETVKASDDMHKILHNGQIYILRDGIIYNAQGAIVEK